MTSKFGFGVLGVGFAQIFNSALIMIFVMIYSWKFSGRNIHPIPNEIKSYLGKNELKIYFGISGPSIVMLCAEWWAFEVLVFLAAFISVGAVSAMAISYNYFTLIFQFPSGF